MFYCRITVITLKSTHGWRNTHWPRRHLFSSYEAVMLDQMASLPLGLTWVWINIPDSYLTFIKHVIGSGPWLIWAHQFVLSYREVRTISLFTHMGIFICLRGWEHRQNEPPLSKARWGIWRHLLMVTPVFAFALSILIHTNKNTARGIPFSYACNENNHGKHHKLLKSKALKVHVCVFHDAITEIILFSLLIQDPIRFQLNKCKYASPLHLNTCCFDHDWHAFTNWIGL